MAATDLLAWARQVRADFERLSANLLDLDSDPAGKLLAAGGLRGTSEAPAKAATEALARMWTLLPLVRAQLDIVEEERARGRKADEARIERTLHAPLILLDTALVPASSRRATAAPTTTVELTVSDAMNMLVTDYATAADVIGRIGAAWRDGVPLIDTTRMRLDALTTDIGPFPEAEATAAALDVASAAAATDPLLLGETLAPLRDALERAEAAHRTLVERRDGLRRDLDAAAAQLAAIDQTVRDGTVALDDARRKVRGAQGLLAPLDAIAVLDTAPRGLTPWLERLRTTAEQDWRAAVNGLVAWRAVADGTQRTATAILEANRAPVSRRNELRGLLGGLAAKAAAAGRAEDAELSRLHREARDLLFVAPCDLDAAQAAVDAFARAVNRRGAPPSQEDRR